MPADAGILAEARRTPCKGSRKTFLLRLAEFFCMKNLEIARLLYDLADLYEMKGVKWKPIAFRKAARAIETSKQEIEELYRTGGIGALRRLPGVGEGIAGRIEELLTTGKLKEYERMAKSLPEGAEELMHVMGIGPKRAIFLSRRLKIRSIAELEEAAKAGKIRRLPGFGSKSEADILKAISLLKMGEERKLLGVALPIARELEARIKKIAGVRQAVASGSLRRMKETVGDIDILTTAKDAKPVMGYFTSMPEVVHVIAKGTTKSAVVLRWGPHQIQADVRVLEPGSFGAALQYFTGNVEHNVRLRRLAIAKGWKLNEYGIFDRSGRQIAGRTEEEVYRKLGLQWVPPELREDRGEVEAALKHRLPHLIGYGDLKGDLHVHTKWSDGTAATEAMVKAAQELGYSYVAITDHSKSQHIARGLDEKRLKQHIEEIRKLQKRFPEIRIMAGSEVDILPNGRLDYPDSLLAELDIVVGSVHSRFKSTKEEMTQRILRAMDNPHLKIIGHPTGRLINQREPYQVDLAKVFEKAAERGIALEVNSFPNRLDLKDVHIRQAKETGCMLSIDTDSHAPDHLHYAIYGIAQARRGWLEARDVINTRPLQKLENWLGER